MLTQELALKTTELQSAGIVDIDVTFFAALAIFLLLLGFLNAVLFKPYIRILEERDKKIEGAQNEAASMTAKADATLAEYDAQMAEARAAASELREELRTQGKAQETAMLTDARSDATDTIQTGQAKMKAQLEEAEKSIESKASQLSDAIADRVLSRA